MATPTASGAAKPPNPLVALLANRASLSSLLGSVVQLGARGLAIVSRTYLGPLAYRVTIPDSGANTSEKRLASSSSSSKSSTNLTPTELAILALAVTKLAFEIGELALYNPDVDATGRMPEFTLDEQGHAPALSLAHVLAAVRWWNANGASRTASSTTERMLRSNTSPPSAASMLVAARTAQYASSPRYAYATTSTSSGVAMTKSSSRGCSSCGGATRMATSSYTAAPKPSVYARATAVAGNRLAGAATTLGTASKSGCGCGCGGGSTTTTNGCGCGCSAQTCGCGCNTQPQTCGCGSGLPATRTYDSTQCPTFAISCETKTALRDCMKVALCDFMRCLADTVCPDGRFDSNVFSNQDFGKELIDCVGQLACSFVHCVPDALCGAECSSPPVNDCEPCCDYAVEVLR